VPFRPVAGNYPRLIVVACCAVFLVGCGLTLQQRAAVQGFSAAAIDFATLTSSELARSRTDVLAHRSNSFDWGTVDW
jgi:hypothetical protein